MVGRFTLRVCSYKYRRRGRGFDPHLERVFHLNRARES